MQGEGEFDCRIVWEKEKVWALYKNRDWLQQSTKKKKKEKKTEKKEKKKLKQEQKGVQKITKPTILKLAVLAGGVYSCNVPLA